MEHASIKDPYGFFHIRTFEGHLIESFPMVYHSNDTIKTIRGHSNVIAHPHNVMKQSKKDKI